MSNQPLRPYRGPLKAAILDWAGTTVDYGSCAPATAFVELFERNGVSITMEEARRPMGAHKRDHIAAILAEPKVAADWRKAHGHPPAEGDIDALYEQFVPLQVARLAAHADLVPGTLEAVAEFRRRGLRIGTSTGYNSEMMAVVVAEAKKRGYEPDCVVAVDEVPAGRPAPWMCLENAKRLGVYPWEAIVKVGDTVPDVLEGLNAGVWSVAVAKTGNEIGLPEEEIEALAKDVLEAKLAEAHRRLAEAGAHYVVDGIGNVPAVLDEIQTRLSRGDRP
jgi:phosphonoacetaldehyde hydrolase